MAILLIGEYREGKFFESTYDLVGYAAKFNKSFDMFAVGNKNNTPIISGKLYFAHSSKYGEYNPNVHNDLIIDLLNKVGYNEIVFLHSTYGWDVAPRLAHALDASLITEVIDITYEGEFVKPIMNGKLQAIIKPNREKKVLTIQSGAFAYEPDANAQGEIISYDVAVKESPIKFISYEEVALLGVDLSKADVIVSVGRGIGKKENIKNAEDLAKHLKGELGASRPIVDAGWLDYSRQVGLTGQTVSPKLYIACGISGSIQHLAGMKKSNYIIAINTDREAPISEVADVLVVADVNEVIKELLKLIK
jgi:electron transfer flavoprotein alpha subunit